MVTLAHLFAVGAGAALGAIGRWLLGLWLNHSGAVLPWGTLAANGLGAYVIGLLLALVVQWPAAPDWLKLFMITGFLGGLTTFSTFSAETIGLLQRGDWLAALGYAFISLVGSLALTVCGFYTVQRLLA